jgi:4-coumarate--CoA ligase (photoactive yellow protein activation family)
MYSIGDKYAPDALLAVGRQGNKRAFQLWSDANKLAELLRQGPEQGEVLVACEDRYFFTVAVLAAWRQGRVVALPPNTNPEAIETIKRQVAVAHVLTDKELSELEQQGSHDPGNDVPEELINIRPDQRLATLYTSGSTGEPQPCRKSAEQLLGEARMHAQHFSVHRDSCVIATVPARHIYGFLFSVLMPLLSGARLVRETPSYPETIEELAVRLGADILISVPAHLQGLSALSTRKPRFSEIFSSGAPLPPTTARMLCDLYGVQVTEIFGSSETGGIGYRFAPAEELWRPLPGVSVSSDSDGKLLLCSPYAAAPPDAPYPCADRAEILSDGRFRHLGREDGIVKVAGKRVSLAEIELRLLELEGVKDAATLSVPVNGLRGFEVWAAVVAPGWTVRELRTALRRWFEPVAQPRRIRLVDSLPREKTGKLRREALAALWKKPLQPKVGLANVPGTDFDVKERAPRREGDEQTYAFEIYVPEKLRFFDGHFNGNPILPGIVQINDLVIGRVEATWPEIGGLRSIVKAKFKRPIRPKETVDLTIRRRAGAPEIRFQITVGDSVCSNGTLLFADEKSL